MPPLLNAQNITKAFGPRPLFRELSFTVDEGSRIGLIGPTAQASPRCSRFSPARKRLTPASYPSANVPASATCRRSPTSQPDETVWSVMEDAVRAAQVPATDWDKANSRNPRPGRLHRLRSSSCFALRRLAQAARHRAGPRRSPRRLLLDEPTNHLDLEGIEWLEGILNGASFASVTISHDRYFLENVALEIAEINPVYPAGILRTRGNYSRFLEDKEAFLEAQQRRQEALENRVRTEIEWLRRGPKARATKAKARIDNAHALIGELAEVTARNRTAAADIEFTESGRESKRLVDTRPSRATRSLAAHSSAISPSRSRREHASVWSVPTAAARPPSCACCAANWSPPPAPSSARTHCASSTSTRTGSSIPRSRCAAPSRLTATRSIYQDRVIHVASWASRFLFTSEQLNQPVANLSGGERARVLIAKLMLEPADLLLLDEPTNDLDISTLEILEESLLEFRGALVLVTHDRYLLDRVSTVVLGLDGNGNAGPVRGLSAMGGMARRT